AGDRLDAQPAAHDRRLVSHQAPPARLASRRSALHGRADRRPALAEQRQLAVGRRDGRRRAALPPHLLAAPPGRALRPRGHLREAVGAGAVEGAGEADPPAVGARADGAPGTVSRLSTAARRPRRGTGAGAGGVRGRAQPGRWCTAGEAIVSVASPARVRYDRPAWGRSPTPSTTGRRRSPPRSACSSSPPRRWRPTGT